MGGYSAIYAAPPDRKPYADALADTPPAHFTVSMRVRWHRALETQKQRLFLRNVLACFYQDMPGQHYDSFAGVEKRVGWQVRT
ncbi:hypothetical protein GCM10023096_48130 [Nonomuraea ferruginea]